MEIDNLLAKGSEVSLSKAIRHLTAMQEQITHDDYLIYEALAVTKTRDVWSAYGMHNAPKINALLRVVGTVCVWTLNISRVVLFVAVAVCV